MKLLLDTHALIWFLQNDARLPMNLADAIELVENEALVSTATFWEMAIKVSLGKLEMDKPFEELEKRIFQNGMKVHNIAFRHSVIVSELPHYHRDPFDRMLIAQALSDDLTLVSNETVFDKYGVKRIW